VHVLRTLRIIGVNKTVTAEAMKVYDSVFATPIPVDILAAIAAIVGRELPQNPASTPSVVTTAGCPIEA